MERYSNKQSGFTLLEMVVVVAILAIVSILAIPDLHTTWENYRLKTAAVDLLSYFQKAKMEAVKRGTDVVLSFTAGADGSYEIFVDNGAGGGVAGNWTRDGGEERICQIQTEEGITLESATFSGTTTTCGFDSRGMPLGNRIGNVRLKNKNNKIYRLSTSLAGNINLKKE